MEISIEKRNLIGMYMSRTAEKTAERMREGMLYVEDPEMKDLMNETVNDLMNMKAVEFMAICRFPFEYEENGKRTIYISDPSELKGIIEELSDDELLSISIDTGGDS